ncbi:YadA family autotransporter adhesin [Caballeronia hypogeia]|uniref:YadA family autotransporter adhesin n=1 Tax=Caballeronia hypogeia TaxID=1777140 RepID=UPI000772D086
MAALVAGLIGVPVQAQVSINGMSGSATNANSGTSYNQFLYRDSIYYPGSTWNSATSLGFSTVIGDFARTASNTTDDAIFGRDGSALNGRGGETALGSMSLASGETATALGTWAQATRAFSLAVGGNATASGIGAMALGREALASGHYSIGEGFLATATGVGSIGVGASANASGARSIAIGTSGQLTTGDTAADASFRGTSSARASGADSVSIGTNAAATADNSVSLGKGAIASAMNSAALGAGSTTTANLTASGYNPGSGVLSGIASTASGEISIGSPANERRLTNVAAGAAATDAVNVSQLQSQNAKVDKTGADIAATLGGGTTYDPATGTISGTRYTVAGGAQSNVGEALRALDSATVQFNGLGGAANVKGQKIVNVSGGTISASSTDGVNGSQLYGVSYSVASALGGGSAVNPDGSISQPNYTVGGKAFRNVGDALSDIDTRTAGNTTDINDINNILNNITKGGTGIKYFHANSTLADSQASGADAVAIGGNARAGAVNSVALGSNSIADRVNTVSVGAAGAERQITNVAAGTADTDAVNVAQLRASGLVGPDGKTNAAVTYDRNGDGSTNYGSISLGNGAAGGTVIHNVAAGVANTDAANVGQVNAMFEQVRNAAATGNPMFAADGNRDTEAALASGARSTAMGANAVAAASNAVAIGADSVASRNNTVSVGSASNARQITNVAAGTQGTDAVNLDQLNASMTKSASQAQNYTDQRFNTLQNNINDVAKNSYAGIAAAMAMPNLTPATPGKTIVAAGAAAYKNGSAVAAGATYRSASGRWLTNGAVSVTNTGDAGVRAQVGYEF